jgi:SAM-dependent methyltransferase
MEEPGFGADLYRGTAEVYDRHRLPYPPAMVSALLERVAGRTRAMDLACGTGQLTVPLCKSFGSMWAVDQEPEMVRVVTAKRLPGVRAAGGARGHTRPGGAAGGGVHAPGPHLVRGDAPVDGVLAGGVRLVDLDPAAARLRREGRGVSGGAGGTAGAVPVDRHGRIRLRPR